MDEQRRRLRQCGKGIVQQGGWPDAFLNIDAGDCLTSEEYIRKKDWLPYAFYILKLLQEKVPPVPNWMPLIFFDTHPTKSKMLDKMDSLSATWFQKRLRIRYWRIPALHYVENSTILPGRYLKPEQDWKTIVQGITGVEDLLFSYTYVHAPSDGYYYPRVYTALRSIANATASNRMPEDPQKQPFAPIRRERLLANLPGWQFSLTAGCMKGRYIEIDGLENNYENDLPCAEWIPRAWHVLKLLSKPTSTPKFVPFIYFRMGDSKTKQLNQYSSLSLRWLQERLCAKGREIPAFTYVDDLKKLRAKPIALDNSWFSVLGSLEKVTMLYRYKTKEYWQEDSVYGKVYQKKYTLELYLFLRRDLDRLS